MPVYLNNNQQKVPVPRKVLINRAERILRELKEPLSEVSILIVDDNQIRCMNRRYRKKNKPTDVLSFCQREGLTSQDETVLGDVVISIETARAQALIVHYTLQHELVRYLIHGMLHLVGYDHATDHDEERMQTLTDKLMRVCDVA